MYDDKERNLLPDLGAQERGASMELYNELTSAVEYGEITEEQFEFAKGIVFNIIEEDIVLFIQGMRDDIGNVESVSYGDFLGEYDGQYKVTMKDSSVKYYGWYNRDTVATLHPIEA